MVTFKMHCLQKKKHRLQKKELWNNLVLNKHVFVFCYKNNIFLNILLQKHQFKFGA